MRTNLRRAAHDTTGQSAHPRAKHAAEMVWGRKIPSEPSSTAPPSRGNGVTAFAHPGSFGVMMLPSELVRTGLPSRRRDQIWGSEPGEETVGAGGDGDKKASTDEKSAGGNPICDTRVNELVTAVQRSKDAERELKADFNSLDAKKRQLVNEILKLEREKEELTEKHVADLARIREKLEAEADEDKRRLKEELKKGHDASMDQLRKDLRARIAPLESETERLRLEVSKAQARAASVSNNSTPDKRARFGGARHNGVADPATPSAAATGATLNRLAAGANRGDEDNVPTSMPTSPSFWKGLNDAFTPHDLLFDTSGGVVRGGGESGVGLVEKDSVPPPALLVLAAVPICCLLAKWHTFRANRQR